MRQLLDRHELNLLPVAVRRVVNRVLVAILVRRTRLRVATGGVPEHGVHIHARRFVSLHEVHLVRGVEVTVGTPRIGREAAVVRRD